MRYTITTLLFFMFSFANTIFAQDINTFTLNQDGKDLVVTQNIDASFLGYYTKNAGKQKWEFGLFNNGKSFFFKQTLSDPFNKEYDWDDTKKEAIQWGVLVEDGKIATRTVSEYKNGEIQNYQAMVLVYQTNNTEKTYDVLLFEKDGAFHLESTTKTNVVASVE
jgi:hypothetical protein